MPSFDPKPLYALLASFVIAGAILMVLAYYSEEAVKHQREMEQRRKYGL